MPTPTDNGTTYTFKIREGVKWHDGSPLTAADVAASWNHIIHPPPGYNSARANWYQMVDTVSAPDADYGGVQAEVRHAHVPAGARRPVCLHLQAGHPGQGPELVHEEHHGQRAVQVRCLRLGHRSRASAIRTTTTRGCPISMASSASTPTSRWCAPRQCAATGRRPNSAACRPRRSISSRRNSATRSPSSRATGTAAT